ncbi:MAG: type II toxin-antitoxin system HigB family toxin [Gammaproteobacteria bacterium]|nr:type II toxin-antitoxin system HigB family toxin [Gammaproteobacteria bacterium]MBU1655203.1 type II toxin-antitoxin system HigB family toxin [Gammaproteobacteria bacterium]MBU1962802.1 type II toxin-antitoxin system HigB family toxin [Gammaproteobacteria bacterium]
MHIITQKRIRDAQAQWPQASTALQEWERVMKKAEPACFTEMKAIFNAVDKVGHLHVFDTGGNKLRLIAKVEYRWKRVYIRPVLDHDDYARGGWK